MKRFITIILFYLYASVYLSLSHFCRHTWLRRKRKIIIKQKHMTMKTNKNYFSFFSVQKKKKVYNFIVEIYELLVVSGLSNHWVGNGKRHEVIQETLAVIYAPLENLPRFLSLMLIHFLFFPDEFSVKLNYYFLQFEMKWTLSYSSWCYLSWWLTRIMTWNRATVDKARKRGKNYVTEFCRFDEICKNYFHL